MPKSDNIRTLPSAEYLRECFDYNPKNGELRWKARPWEHFIRPADFVRCNAMAGDLSGYIDNGYRRVSLDGVDHKAHRIIWKWMTGEEPPLMLDHKDLDRSNNRWENLRGATQAGQTQNTRLRKDNPFGKRGVYAEGKKYKAVVAGRRIGRFNTVEEASAAYEAVACDLFGEFYRKPQNR